MTTTAAWLQEAVSKTLADLLTPERRHHADQGAWEQELWPALVELGLPLLLVSSERGGSGATPAEGFGVIRALGQFALACPLAETMLANFLLAEAGLPTSDQPLAFATLGPIDTLELHPDTAGWRLSGALYGVPWGRQTTALVAPARSAAGELWLCRVANADNRLTPNRSLAGEPRDDLHFAQSYLPAAAAVPLADPERLWRAGALLRAAQIAGTLGAVLELCVRYANERQQFGRPIGTFQAIQHAIAQLAAEATAANAAARKAFGLLAQPDAWLEAAAAKIYAGRAASTGAAIAHQVHGAIGFTEEYSLQRLTRRLWSWREEFGNEAWWAEHLGQRLAAAGADAVWPRLTLEMD